MHRNRDYATATGPVSQGCLFRTHRQSVCLPMQQPEAAPGPEPRAVQSFWKHLEGLLVMTYISRFKGGER